MRLTVSRWPGQGKEAPEQVRVAIRGSTGGVAGAAPPPSAYPSAYREKNPITAGWDGSGRIVEAQGGFGGFGGDFVGQVAQDLFAGA
jgi:hypothetical protein